MITHFAFIFTVSFKKKTVILNTVNQIYVALGQV